MQEMLYPTSYLKSMGLGKNARCSLTAASPVAPPACRSVSASPEAASGGAIGLVEEGDTIEIDIPNRRIHLAVSDAVLVSRRSAMDAQGEAAWKPRQRRRVVSASLRAYAAMATSADTGAVRDVSKLAGGN